jgi:hypothetical protein
VGPQDTSAKPGSQYWIVGHGGWRLHLRKSGGNLPKRPKISRRLPSYSRSVVFYAVVCDEIEQVLEFFKTRVEAETMLGRVLVDEPDWRDVLHVEPIELVTGGEN